MVAGPEMPYYPLAQCPSTNAGGATPTAATTAATPHRLLQCLLRVSRSPMGGGHDKLPGGCMDAIRMSE